MRHMRIAPNSLVSISVVFESQPPNRRKLPNHGMILFALVLHELLLSLLFDLINLRSDESQPIHGASNFGRVFLGIGLPIDVRSSSRRLDAA